MLKIRGIEHFTKYFKEFKNDYVIIGGGASAILLEDVGLEFRATKDIDIVILTNSSRELNKKICKYVDDGGYKTKSGNKSGPRYYRFAHPTNILYPQNNRDFRKK